MKSNHLLPRRITASIPSHQPKMSAKVLLPLLPVVSQDILLAIFSKAFSLTEFLLLLFLNYDHNPFFFFFSLTLLPLSLLQKSKTLVWYRIRKILRKRVSWGTPNLLKINPKHKAQPSAKYSSVNFLELCMVMRSQMKKIVFKLH